MVGASPATAVRRMSRIWRIETAIERTPDMPQNRFYAHFAGRANADAANLSCPPPVECSLRGRRCRYYRRMGRAGLLRPGMSDSEGVELMMRAILAVLG